MYPIYSSYQPFDLQTQIMQSIARLDKYQQQKLLEFVNSMCLNTKKNEPHKLLKYAGFINTTELEAMKIAITDCEKIDYNEW